MENIQAQARVMEPIYRMIKVVENYDVDDARVLGALATQHIAEQYKDEQLNYAEVQSILRKVLLYYKEGKYYADYLSNELQVKIVGWITILAADLTLTIGKIGEIADALAEWLKDKDALQLNGESVLMYFFEIAEFDQELFARMEWNKDYYLRELVSIIGK